MTTGIALAEGMVFDPTEYQATTTQKGAVQSNASIEKKTQASSTYAQDAISGQNSNFEGYMSKFIQGKPFEYSLIVFTTDYYSIFYR